MPIYEYNCAGCKRRVSLFYQTFSAAGAAIPTCPNCSSTDLTRLVSRVFQLRSEDAQLEDLADPSSFGDLDENDPKSVARYADFVPRDGFLSASMGGFPSPIGSPLLFVPRSSPVWNIRNA